MWLYLLQVLAVVLAASGRKNPTKAVPDYTIYHSEELLMESVVKIVESSHSMRIELPSHTENNYTAEVPIVTVSPPRQAEGEVLRVLVDFGEHAREFISADTGLHFLKLLAEKDLLASQFASLSLKAGEPGDTEALLAFLDCCVVLKVVPMENREGRKLIERTGDFCERKNGHGVDPNRNWEVDWGKREKDYSAYEENAGLHAFSEPETYILRELAHDFKPHVWVNVHSGMDGLFMPYDHVGHIPDHPSSGHTLHILEEINARTCEGKCVVGSGGKSVGYLAHGTATDYMYEKANVSIAMTWEIYGDENAHFHDCFKMFNPLTKAGYDSIVTAWTNALFVLLLQVQQHPDVAHLTLQDPQTLDGNVPSVGDTSTSKEVVSSLLADAGMQPAVNVTSDWNTGQRGVLDQEQGVWLRLVVVVLVMTVSMLYAVRVFLVRRSRLTKAAVGHRESR